MFELSIIPIILLLLFFLIFWKITKIIWKAILFAIIVLVVFIGLTGYLVYTDVQKMINEEKIIIITSESNAIVGATMFNNLSEIKYIPHKELELITQNIKLENYNEILGDRYILLILETELLNFEDKQISINGDEYKVSEAIDLMLTNTTEDFLKIINNISSTSSIQTTITENEVVQYKKRVGENIIKEIINDKTSSKNLVKDVVFYPNRITFVLLTKTPQLLTKLVSLF